MYIDHAVLNAIKLALAASFLTFLTIMHLQRNAPERGVSVMPLA